MDQQQASDWSPIDRVLKRHAGGVKARAAAAAAVVGAGVATMGHVGLMPQSISVLGGFRPQGQTAAEALRVMHQARVRAWRL